MHLNLNVINIIVLALTNKIILSSLGDHAYCHQYSPSRSTTRQYDTIHHNKVEVEMLLINRVKKQQC